MSEASTPAESQTPTVKAAKKADKIGTFPRDLDTSALPERRSAALARILGIVATVEGAALVAMSFAMAAMMPLQKVVPMVVTSNDKGDEIIHINPITIDAPTADYLTEINLRNYVQRRYSIVASAAEQQVNWGGGSVVQLMSTPETFKRFMEQAKPEYDRLRGAGMIRTVRIAGVSKIAENTWQVAYVTTDLPEQSPFTDVSTGRPQSWIGTYEIKYEPKNVTYSQRLNNPLGMTVLSANDARRD